MSAVRSSLRTGALATASILLSFGCAQPGEFRAERSSEWALERTPLDRAAAELEASTARHLAEARELYERIVAPRETYTIDNTLVPYNRLAMHLDAASSENQLLFNVHPSAEVRDVAEQGAQQISRYSTELSLSRELYDAITAVDVSDADAATRFSVEKTLRDFRRSGVDRDATVRARVQELNDELTKLGQAFSRNIAEDVREVRFAADGPAFDGLPADWVAAHEADEDGSIAVTTQYPDYIPFMRYSGDADARRRLYLEYNNRAYPANEEVLLEVARKRHELATLLGYEDWADYVTADKMIGSAENARAFIEQVSQAASASVERDYGMLLHRKRVDVPGATRVADWEKAYYGNLVRQEEFAFDAQAARPYFDFADVREGLFTLTSQLFGVRYEPVEGLDLWHDDVTAYDVFDGDEQIGRFYLDLHPRPNKYGHAACFPYRAGIEGERLPQAVLVCNFPDPGSSENGVALMEFSEVTTFFHEFGHLLHAMFGGHRRWMNNTGISTEWDFVEAPSQMLEEWCYDVESLQMFARHHETGEPIPAELVAKLRTANDFGKGVNTAHQMFYASVSLGLYDRSPEDLDLTEHVKAQQARYTPYAYEDGTHMFTSFGHLYGYSAIYYTYMWSQVIAKDLFSRFQAEGLMEPRTSREYRRLLEAGGSAPAAALVEDFLGREFSFDSFQRWLDEAPDA